MKQQPPAKTTDFEDFIQRARLAYARLLDDARSWAERSGERVDIDVFAIIIASRVHMVEDAEVTYWTRRQVGWMTGHVPRVCQESGVELPMDYLVQLKHCLTFLSETDWLDDWSDRLSALLQPLSCGFWFVVEGEPIPPGFHDIARCHCMNKFRGRSHGFTKGRLSK